MDEGPLGDDPREESTMELRPGEAEADAAGVAAVPSSDETWDWTEPPRPEPPRPEPDWADWPAAVPPPSRPARVRGGAAVLRGSGILATTEIAAAPSRRVRPATGRRAAARRRRARWPVRNGWLAWGVVVLLLSVAPVSWVFGAVPEAEWSWLAAAGHFIEFGLFAALVALSRNARSSWGAALLLGALAGAVYGALIEVVQLAVPWRGFDMRDMAADWAGVAACVLLLSLARRREAGRRARRG